MRKKFLPKEHGSVMVAVLALVGAVAIILGAASTLTTSGYRKALIAARQLQALYAAEAGIEDFLYKKNNGIDISTNKVGEEESNYVFQIEDFTFKYPKIPSDTMDFVGISSGIAKTITCNFEEEPSMPAVFRNALASETDLELTGNSLIRSSDENKIHGNVYAHHDIEAKGNTYISGAAISAYGTVTIRGNATIEQGILEGEAYYQEIPEVTEEMRITWMNKAQSGTNYSDDLTYSGNNNLNLSNTFIDGNLHLTGNTHITLENNAVVYIRGNLHINGNASVKGQGIFIVEGTITLNGNMEHVLNQPASVAFVSLSDGESTINGNGEVTGVFFAPNGTIKIAGNSQIFGSVVGEEIKFTGNADIVYNVDLLDNPPPLNPNGVFRLTHWEEKFS
ncbi:MAG: hypothetical protein PWP60_1154 [Candidatus Atribacteria bacterium]|jgi:hypothetical protein|uniref:DUF7305 domain-containing protein n=1 Tax=Thermatribacter velox TaxID=3039681 RepID=A0ABZ2YG15_9BACT|nr:hypothetical protein [Candidatus Atribacteria bacterium]